jgi:hypothetical protein
MSVILGARSGCRWVMGSKGYGHLSSLTFCIHVLLSRSTATDLALLHSLSICEFMFGRFRLLSFKVLYGVHTFSHKNKIFFSILKSQCAYQCCCYSCSLLTLASFLFWSLTDNINKLLAYSALLGSAAHSHASLLAHTSRSVISGNASIGTGK